MTALLRRPSWLLATLVGLVACAALGWAVLPKPALYGDIAFSTLVVDREGRPLKLVPAKDGRYRLFTALDDIAPVAQEATLLYEDRGFHRHHGVDFVALARAAWTTYVRRSRVVGGSTITMQLARLRFGLDTRTVLGKLVQCARSVQLERHFDKDEILEAYLNLAPYGGSIEGIGTASRIYFDKPAGVLSPGEALALAVIPQNPAARFPARADGRRELLAARGRLLAIWQSESGGVDPGALARARLEPTFRHPSQLPSHAPHFVRDHVPLGSAARIRTTLDLDLQHLLEARIADHLDRRRRDGIVNAAAILVDGQRMGVRALVGSAGFFDEAIAGQVNGVRARRSPGSTLKPLLYALAMDQGLIHPMTLLEDAPRRYAAYTPENFDRGFMGPVFARDALIHSRNVPAVGLLADLGVERFRGWLHDAGVTGLRSAEEYGLALALGGSEITMEELVRLYAALASGGAWRELAVVPGSVVAKPRRLLSREASFLVLDMLRDVVRPDPPTRDRAERQTVAWKTGTSFGFRDAWSVGIVGHHVLAVWVGNFDGSANPALVGREAAAPLFFAIADSLAENKSQRELATVASAPWAGRRSWAGGGGGAQRMRSGGLESLPASSGEVEAQRNGRPWWAAKDGADGLNLRRVDVCATTGDLPGPHCPRTTRSWFIPGVSPIKVSTVYRAIDIDPRTGLRSCSRDADTERVVYEFWPSNLHTVFRRAGIAVRRPPPWSPECGLDETSATGTAPRIRSPQRSLVYHAAAPDAVEGNVLFSAVVDGDARRMYWFVDHRLVASTAPGEDYFWMPRPGRFTVRVVDDLGRAAAEPIRVRAFPG